MPNPMDASRLRKDFSILSEEDGRTPPIYFDSACQTLRPRQVTDAASEYYEAFPACGGRSVHRLATEVSIRCDAVREKAADFFNAEAPSEISFMKNSTEGLNTVILGSGLGPGDEVVTTDHEHNAVHVPLLQLASACGIKRRIVESSEDGTFDLEAYKEAVTRKTKLVAMCFTSNVTGLTLPAKEVVDIAHASGARVLFDAAQAAPCMKLDVRALGVDFMTASAHKMCGPSGVGLFYCRSEHADSVMPIMFGGHGIAEVGEDSFRLGSAPERFETGLQNYSGIIGTGAAMDYLSAVGLDEIREHEMGLNKRITRALRDITAVRSLPPADPNLRGGIFSFNIDGLTGHDVAMILDNSRDIMMRSGMHCCHSYFRHKGVEGCARASVYLYNTKEEVDVFTEAVTELAAKAPRRA